MPVSALAGVLCDAFQKLAPVLAVALEKKYDGFHGKILALIHLPVKPRIAASPLMAGAAVLRGEVLHFMRQFGIIPPMKTIFNTMLLGMCAFASVANAATIAFDLRTAPKASFARRLSASAGSCAFLPVAAS